MWGTVMVHDVAGSRVMGMENAWGRHSMNSRTGTHGLDGGVWGNGKRHQRCGGYDGGEGLESWGAKRGFVDDEGSEEREGEFARGRLSGKLSLVLLEASRRPLLCLQTDSGDVKGDALGLEKESSLHRSGYHGTFPSIFHVPPTHTCISIRMT